ncbi:hypothetical protein ACWCP6_33440 [Streptomyces sp. NPDC002004]
MAEGCPAAVVAVVGAGLVASAPGGPAQAADNPGVQVVEGAVRAPGEGGVDEAQRGLASEELRSSLIRLTERGRTAIAAVIDRERAVLRQAGGDLTDIEVDACLRVLSRRLALMDNVDVD